MIFPPPQARIYTYDSGKMEIRTITSLEFNFTTMKIYEKIL